MTNEEEAKIAEYKVNPLLVEHNDGLTGIRIRALHPEDGWGSYDVACLMADDFDLWLTAKDNRPVEVAKQLLTKLLEMNGKVSTAAAKLEEMSGHIATLTAAIDELTED